MLSSKRRFQLEQAIDSRWFGYVIQAIICISVALYWYECDALKTANSRVGPIAFLWAERTIAGILTFEFLSRLLLAKNKKQYLLSNKGIIDALAIIPFWVGFYVPASWLGAIRASRSLRLLKFYRYNEVMQCLFEGFRRNDKSIKVIVLLTCIFIIFMACLLHEIEGQMQPDKFGTITGTLWFALVTVATVGFGDVYPVTTVGKWFTGLCIFGGVSIYASWLAIVGTVVHSALSKYDEEENKKEDAARLINAYASVEKE